MHATRTKQCLFTVSAAVLLAACAGPSQVTLADGSVAYRISCDGTAVGMNYCFERAGKSCGADGYTVVDQDGRTISTSAVAEQDTEALVRSFSTDQNSMLVKCGS